MNLPAERRLTVALVVVVAVTLVYLVIEDATDDHGVVRASTVASLAAIGLALAKLRIIVREFMDVRHAPRVLRILTDALVATMGVLLVGTYLIGRAIA